MSQSTPNTASPTLQRPRLVERLLAAALPGAHAYVIAPTGYGKTALLKTLRDTVAPAERGALYVSIGECEGHPGLFRDQLLQEVRRVLPAADVRALVTSATDETATGLGYALSALLEGAPRQPSDGLLLLIDDIHLLQRGEPLAEAIADLMGHGFDRIGVVLAGRERPDFLPQRKALFTSDALQLDAREVATYLGGLGCGVSADMAARVFDATRGWPAVVQLLGSALCANGGEASGLLSAQGDALTRELVAHLLKPLRPEVQYFAKVVSILERVELSLVRAIFAPGGAGGSPDARRRLIGLSEAALPGYIAQLQAQQLLSRADGGGDDDGLAFNPVVRTALRAQLEAADPEGYREAHRRAAEHLLASADIPSAAALDGLLAAGEHDRLQALLRERAEDVYRSGATRPLQTWLEGLSAHYGALPFWGEYYLGRIATLRGAWDDARAHLDRARDAMGSSADAPQWRWQPRLALGYGAMMWRRGLHADARTYAQRGLDYLERALQRDQLDAAERDEAQGLRLRLLTVLGQVAMEVGSYERAADALERALTATQAAGMDAYAPEIYAYLALNAARAANRDAGRRWTNAGLALAVGPQHARARGALESARARIALAFGELDAASRYAANAVAIHRAGGHRSALAAALGIAGRVAIAQGDTAAAGRAFDDARAALFGTGNVGVIADVLDHEAFFRLAQGDRPRAVQLHDEAGALIASVLRMDGYLAALHAEVAAELRLADERVPKRGLRYIELARDSYDRFGAQLDVARLHWRQAELCHARVLATQDDEAREQVMVHLEACAASPLASALNVARADAVPLLLIAARLSEGAAVEFAHDMLARLGVDPDAQAPEHMSDLAPYEALRMGIGSSTPYVLLTREGARAADADEVDRLEAGGANDALVVFVETRQVLNYSKTIDLSQKRVILPLLLEFLRDPGASFTMRELAERVWGAEEMTPAIQTKVKVAVSRLRSLLGKGRKYVDTMRKEEDGANVVAYALADGVDYIIVDEASAAEAHAQNASKTST